MEEVVEFAHLARDDTATAHFDGPSDEVGGRGRGRVGVPDRATPRPDTAVEVVIAHAVADNDDVSTQVFFQHLFDLVAELEDLLRSEGEDTRWQIAVEFDQLDPGLGEAQHPHDFLLAFPTANQNGEVPRP